jgi:acetyl esterase/lipase
MIFYTHGGGWILGRWTPISLLIQLEYADNL